MSVTRGDVHTVSTGLAPGGVPLPDQRADRIADVLNRNNTHRPDDSRPAQASEDGPSDAPPV